MKAVFKAFLLLVALLIAIGAGGFVYVWRTGVSARDQPGAIERFMARNGRNLAIARRARDLRNPVERAPEVIAAGRAHFADHCAICHANDGSGETTFGLGMWPKPPDMRSEETQKLTDGEIFYIIEQGIRFTGMPGFGTGTREGEEETWHLVHFIRHLPNLSEPELAEMAELNPRSPADIEAEREAQEFLEGGSESAPSPTPTHTHK